MREKKFDYTMENKNFLLLCATLSCFYLLTAAQEQLRQRQIPRTKFTCVGRASGYYADLETGCQVYHMCDGLGRQFSYTCPNTTLFQQRMLVCDHWYMVNCSMSERDYDANLLIGQRDKPFVSDEEMRQWTPRPDILTVPANTNYYDGLKEAETKYSTHPGNSIVGIPDSISSLNNNGLDSAKVNYRPPSSWSTGTGRRTTDTPKDQARHDLHNEESQNSIGAAQNVIPTFKPSPVDPFTKLDNTGFDQTGTGFDQTGTGFEQTGTGFEQTGTALDQTGTRFDQTSSAKTNAFTQSTQRNTRFIVTSTEPTDSLGSDGFTQTTFNTGSSQSNSIANTNVTPLSLDLRPPVRPTTEPTESEEFQIDARMKTVEDPVVKFINRFDPNSPDSIKTAMTKKEIIDINAQLPNEQTSSEDERTPRKQKINENTFNNLDSDKKGNSNSRFDTVNTKPATQPTLDLVSFNVEVKTNQIPLPETDLIPPKNEYSQHTATTMGPPIYYEWKWAAPAFDLEPPKLSNVTYNDTSKAVKDNISPFRSVTRPTPVELDPIPPTKNTEYNISSYFVPDYVFPLDKAHPGYEDEHAQSSFQVEAARPGRSYGENPNCPQCHPAYLEPGTCEPCLVKR